MSLSRQVGSTIYTDDIVMDLQAGSTIYTDDVGMEGVLAFR